MDTSLSEAEEIQVDDKKRINRMKEIIGNTEKIGVNAITELKENKETIIEVDNTMNDVEDNVDSSRKQLKQFLRGVVKDKIFKILLSIVVSGLIFIIIWRIVSPESFATNADTFQK